MIFNNKDGTLSGLSELFQVGGCDEKVGGCKSRRGKTLGGIWGHAHRKIFKFRVSKMAFPPFSEEIY